MIIPNPGEGKCFKVSEITAIIKDLLESGFSNIEIEGEISNFRPSGAGHCYFSLKDSNAVISAVLFKGAAVALPFKPEDGQLVVAKGRISLYEPRGTYQIVCSSLKKAGEGSILAMLEKRKQKLAAEGLFESERKKNLPLFPSRVAVITSPTGAAIQDILRVLDRRNSSISVTILPCTVQGDRAGEAIAEQIRRANHYNMGDVIITGRGGGALEDLLCFSDEAVVRAIAESEIPVITGIGHEIDFTLSDFAADVRAATPSAAAEIVSSLGMEIGEKIKIQKETMIREITGRLEKCRLQLNMFQKEELERIFRIKTEPLLMRLDDLKENLIYGMEDTLTARRHRLELLNNTLQNNSPFLILEKGYSYITDTETGKNVKSSVKIKQGTKLSIRLHQGQIAAQVTEISNKD